MLLRLASKSLLDRKSTLALTLASLVLSVLLLIVVEQASKQVQSSFNRSIAGVSLIIGAPTGQLNLLLYSLFGIGQPSNSLDWHQLQTQLDSPLVDWVVPLALGDSHQGFAVVGTTQALFSHFKFGDQQTLNFNQGGTFGNDDAGNHQVVLGAQVASKLGYQLGDALVLAHGTGKHSFQQHTQQPFVVSGILAPTGTAMDRRLFIHITALAALHGQLPARHAASDHDHDHDHSQQESLPVSAALLGLSSPMAVLQVQRQLNTQSMQPMLAILPGVAMAELWQIIGGVQQLLVMVSLMVLVAALFGMATLLLATMRERQQELAVLRAIGAGPWVISGLLILEALLLMLGAWLIGSGLAALAVVIAQPWLMLEYGVYLGFTGFAETALQTAGLMLLATLIVALLPALGAYKRTAAV